MGELATWSVVIVLAPAVLLGLLWLGWKLLPYVAALGWGLVALFSLGQPDRPSEVGFVAAFLTLVALMWIAKRHYHRR